MRISSIGPQFGLTVKSSSGNSSTAQIKLSLDDQDRDAYQKLLSKRGRNDVTRLLLQSDEEGLSVFNYLDKKFKPLEGDVLSHAKLLVGAAFKTSPTSFSQKVKQAFNRHI